MSGPSTPDMARRRALRRTWRLLVLLRTERLTLEQLAARLDAHPRTIRRDLYAVGDIFPIRTFGGSPVVYTLAPIKEWPRDAVTPIAEAAHL